MAIPPLPTPLQEQLDLGPRNQNHRNTSSESRDVAAPNFTSLYRYLTTEILDPDAGTKSRRKAFEDEKVDERLKAEWVRAAKVRVLSRVLREGSALKGRDAGLREACLGVSGLFEMELDAGTRREEMEEAEESMGEELEVFEEMGAEVGALLGEYLDGTEGMVRQMVGLLVSESTEHSANDGGERKASKIPSSSFPSTTATTKHTRRHIPSTQPLSSSPSNTLLQTHLTNQASLTTQLTQHLSATTTLLSTLLSLHSSLLTSQIHRLETYTYSTHSRHLSTHATFLSTIAHGIALKAEIMSLLREKEVYAQNGMRAALEGMYQTMAGEERDLKVREAELEELLALFEREGGASMEELGREYRRVLAEVEVVRGDLERLEGGRTVRR